MKTCILFFFLIFNIVLCDRNYINKVKRNGQKNVIIIVSDDMGFNDVSYRGSNEIPTYNIDALAYNGIVLDRFYTAPLCTPSRSALLTGKYPHHNGMQNYVIPSDEPWGLPLDEKLMPEYFRDAGYATHMIGKWHLGFFKEEYTPLNRGFDSFYGYLGPYVDYWDYTLEMFGKNYSRGYDMRRNKDVDRSYKGVYATDMFTKEAIKIIDDYDESQKPLFMLINHLAPHAANDDDQMQAKDEDIEKFSYIEDEKRRILAAMIHSLDSSVADLIESLHKANILNDTIIVFFSDNGGPTIGMHSTMASNYPFRGQKGSSWEGATRTGALIYAPFLPKGRIRKQFFYIGDLLPTLLKLANANVEIDGKIDGMDLSNMIVDGKQPFRNEIVTADDANGYGYYLLNGYKLVNGSSSNGNLDTWLGSNNNSHVNSDEYIEKVMESKVFKILENYSEVKLEAEKIDFLRKSSTVKCAGIHNECDLLKGPCLFDIINDPCEENNLATPGNILMKIMEKIFIKELKSALPWVRKPSDPRCDPANFNYTWHWWL